MLLQNSDPIEGSRLKRVVLIGDHYQLPPVVQHNAFKKYSQFDQSLFARFIRLGVPSVMLNEQGRARPEIAALYAWRYLTDGGKYLGNLPGVEQAAPFRTANVGFKHVFQFVDVNDFEGRGESCPQPHFFQNRGEAEFVVATFQYMRLLGYPAEKISIITTYNGQKNLIRDVLAARCLNPFFGRPAKVSTVDKFQGQQNDYILLSLVRTESVGHLRDVRRLVVALSRARLGLYVFGRRSLFENCLELVTVFTQLTSKAPDGKLELVTGESWPTTGRSAYGEAEDQKVHPLSTNVYTVEDVTSMGVLVYQMIQTKQQLGEM